MEYRDYLQVNISSYRAHTTVLNSGINEINIPFIKIVKYFYNLKQMFSILI